MGLQVKRNKEGKYQLISTVSGEKHHEEGWISEDEAKKTLITNAFWDFMEKVVEIDFEFPNRYRVNDIFNREDTGYHAWVSKAYKGENTEDIFATRVEEIFNKLDITIKLGPEKKGKNVT